MNEQQLLMKLHHMMPKSAEQLNQPFESDCEVLNFHGHKLLYSMDEFSEEDMFLEHNPYTLGHNIAVATLSDMYAAGGIPRFYAHSLTINAMFTDRYLERFYQGVAGVLRQAGTAFIGGDFGTSSLWRCCASVIGTAERPIRRSGANIGDSIFITGPIGGGNIQAAAKMYHAKLLSVKFKWRGAEAPLIHQYATACMDTSDGAFQAVNAIADASGKGFALTELPYSRPGVLLAKMLNIPREMLFFCECGEYELLFTAPAGICLPFVKIGEITEGGKTLRGRDVSQFAVSARQFGDKQEYLAMMRALCEEL